MWSQETKVIKQYLHLSWQGIPEMRGIPERWRYVFSCDKWIGSDAELTLYSHMIFEICAIIKIVCLADIRYAMFNRIGVKQWIQKRP